MFQLKQKDLTDKYVCGIVNPGLWCIIFFILVHLFQKWHSFQDSDKTTSLDRELIVPK